MLCVLHGVNGQEAEGSKGLEGPLLVMDGASVIGTRANGFQGQGSLLRKLHVNKHGSLVPIWIRDAKEEGPSSWEPTV